MSNRWQETARGQALLILEEVFEKGAFSNIALNKTLSTCSLSPADKALVTELVYGTITRKITLEWYLSHYVADREKLDSWVYTLLVMSCYQLLYLDKLPDRAVVHEAVALAKARKVGSDKYVNALLRRFLKEPLPEIASIKRVNKRYAIQYALPVWLVKHLLETYGEQRGLAICESLLSRNKASSRVTKPELLEIIQQETASQRSELAPDALVKEHGHFAGTSYFKAGVLTIQDETSQLVAPTLAIKGDERILDACAAPGGKTVHMASYLRTGHVVALDLYEHKLQLIEDNAKRLGVSDKVKTQRLDARDVYAYFGADAFDKILVDAPCSGIGLLRRKPDIRHNKQVADFSQLQAIQLEILASVCQSLKKGGIITYSTCTITREENFEVIAKFLKEHPDFEQVPLVHDKTDVMVDGCLLITPELYGTDGFFIAQVRRKL